MHPRHKEWPKAGPSGEQNTKTKIQIFLHFRFRISYRLDCSE